MPAGFSGCAFWRMRLPFAKLEKVGSRLNAVVAQSGDKHISMDMIRRFSDDAQIMAIQAPGNDDAAMLIRLYSSMGKKVVVDYDDYSFDLSPGNPRYAELGMQECEVLGPDGKVAFCWKDGENGFDLRSNIAKYEGFLSCLRDADLVTTTTEYLAEKFRPHAKKVEICPNSVDFDLWKPIPRPSYLDDQIRIGWFGGDSHLEDLNLLKTLLPRICKKYPKVRIVLQAPRVPQWAAAFSEIASSQMEWHDWADLKYYTLFLASRHWDIGIIPLAVNEFNFCKSVIKHLEFAALKVPTVSQNCLPYNAEIKHGVTGLLADKEDEWFESICRLVENKDLRMELAHNAYKDALTRFNLEKNCHLWEKAYLGLVGDSNGSGST